MIKIHRHAYSQCIRFDGEQTILRANALYVLRVCSEHAVGLPHHADKHGLGCCRHGAADTVEEGGGGEGVVEGEMQEGGTGTGRGINGNQNAVHFAGGGALLGVLGPAALHDDKENGGERCGA
jgi:hypothetical protein